LERRLLINKRSGRVFSILFLDLFALQIHSVGGWEAMMNTNSDVWISDLNFKENMQDIACFVPDFYCLANPQLNRIKKYASSDYKVIHHLMNRSLFSTLESIFSNKHYRVESDQDNLSGIYLKSQLPNGLSMRTVFSYDLICFLISKAVVRRSKVRRSEIFVFF